jgi:hypothetical protein
MLHICYVWIDLQCLMLCFHNQPFIIYFILFYFILCTVGRWVVLAVLFVFVLIWCVYFIILCDTKCVGFCISVIMSYLVRRKRLKKATVEKPVFPNTKPSLSRKETTNPIEKKHSRYLYLCRQLYVPLFKPYYTYSRPNLYPT